MEATPGSEKFVRLVSPETIKIRLTDQPGSPLAAARQEMRLFSVGRPVGQMPL